jgi:glutamate dehydrogenase
MRKLVNVSNVAALTDTEGKPHFKYIVEGANLFFTQQARLHLEKCRVIMFKDSRANKVKITLLLLIHHEIANVLKFILPM